jgi:hypothetical protein
MDGQGRISLSSRFASSEDDSKDTPSGVNIAYKFGESDSDDAAEAKGGRRPYKETCKAICSALSANMETFLKNLPRNRRPDVDERRPFALIREMLAQKEAA